MQSKKVSFKNINGLELVGRVEFPIHTQPLAYAIFAHVFTGNKSLNAVRHISKAMTQAGIAILRFDFTGLGESEGAFAETNFSSNVADIKKAAEFLTVNYETPSILIGHSLGGAAAIFAASEISSIKAVATVGAPSTPDHVTHLFGTSVEQIEKDGSAEVKIGGRPFTIRKQFLDDLRSKDMPSIVKNLKKALLIMHSPQDRVVAIENAAEIYSHAFHPKSFITLDNSDHMLSEKSDAFYAGTVIASWLTRYISIGQDKDGLDTQKQVVARLGDEGFTTDIKAGRHNMIADESEKLGGNDFGPSPYELLNSALAACTAMTLQMYARRKKWDLEEVKVHINFGRSYKEDCDACSQQERRIDKFDLCLELEGDLTQDQINRLLEIAHKCPVHRTLEKEPEFTISLLGQEIIKTSE